MAFRTDDRITLTCTHRPRDYMEDVSARAAVQGACAVSEKGVVAGAALQGGTINRCVDVKNVVPGTTVQLAAIGLVGSVPGFQELVIASVAVYRVYAAMTFDTVVPLSAE